MPVKKILAAALLFALFGQSLLAQTAINVGTTAQTSNVYRMGINLGGNNFYDGGDFTDDPFFRNPGFEGSMINMLFTCPTLTTSGGVVTCISDQPGGWPTNYATGWSFEDAGDGTTAHLGQTGTILSSYIDSGTGAFAFTFAAPSPAYSSVTNANCNSYHCENFAIHSGYIAERAWAGWFIGGPTSTLSTDATPGDQPPGTTGRQHLVVNTTGSAVTVAQYADTSTTGPQFTQLNQGPYTIRFKTKCNSACAGGLNITLTRDGVGTAYLNQAVDVVAGGTVIGSSTWRQQTFTVNPNETGLQNLVGGSRKLAFNFNFGSTTNISLDDFEMVPTAHASAPQEYGTLITNWAIAHKVGTLRYMDSANGLGQTVGNYLVDKFGRQRANWHSQGVSIDAIGQGILGVYQIAQASGAEPMITLFTGTSDADMRLLMNYHAGTNQGCGTSACAGADLRVSQGYITPWSSVFPHTHFALGNEQFGTFPGQNFTDPEAYGAWSNYLFGIAKGTSEYTANSTKFDFIVNTNESNPFSTEHILKTCPNCDRIVMATYNFGRFSDASSTNAIYLPMLAEATMETSPNRSLHDMYLNSGATTAANGTYTLTAATDSHCSIAPQIQVTVSGGQITIPNNNNNGALPYGTQGILNPGLCNSVNGSPTSVAFNLAGGGQVIGEYGNNFIWQNVTTANGTSTVNTYGAVNPKPMGIYEAGPGVAIASVSQANVTQHVASLGEGLAESNQQLKVIRDLGVSFYNTFVLEQLGYSYTGRDGAASGVSPIWGCNFDLQVTGRDRPRCVALQVANQAILPTMLTQTVTSPVTFAQLPSLNSTASGNNIVANTANYVEAYPFTDGTKHSLILTNIDPNATHAVTLSGAGAPAGTCQTWVYNSTNISDNNEASAVVTFPTPTTGACPTSLTLPAHSMTAMITTSGTSLLTSATSLSVSNASPVLGTSVTFSSTVVGSGATPTGTVAFKDGATTIGTGTLASGSTSFSTSSLALGSHTITAVYSGNSTYSGSTSTPATVTVGARPTGRKTTVCTTTFQ